MALLKTEEAYNAAMQRIEELLKIVTDETPTSDSRYLELDFLSDLVEEYGMDYPLQEVEIQQRQRRSKKDGTGDCQRNL